MSDIQKIIDNLKAIDENKPWSDASREYGIEGDNVLVEAWHNSWKELHRALGMGKMPLMSMQAHMDTMRNRLVELLEEALDGEPAKVVSPIVNGFLWPCFEDGTPIQKDDLFIASNGKPVELTTIKLACGGSVGLNPCAWDEGCRLYLNLDEDEHVRRPKLNTQESIDEDAMSNPLYYCEEHGLGYFREDDKDIACRLMVEDLLRRQRELDAKN